MANLLLGAPTEVRVWKTKAGEKNFAAVQKVEDGIVYLKKENGVESEWKLDELVPKDVAFLNKFYKLNPGAGGKGGKAGKGGKGGKRKKGKGAAGGKGEDLLGLGRLQGVVIPGIKSGEYHYSLYLPKSLKKDRLAPMLFYTHSMGGQGGKLMKGLTGMAETLGWIMVMSEECANKFDRSYACVEENLGHILETLPVDPKRIHYTGNSGGAARAFVNTTISGAYGVMPNVGYIPSGIRVKTKVIYALGGGKDYNRYATAVAAKSVKKNGFHRMSSQGHGFSTDDFYEDGMLWMHCKYMNKGKSSLRDEAEDFEKSIIRWLNRVKVSDPMRAYSNARVVRDVYEMSRSNGGELDGIIKELEANEKNVLYYEALLDINELSQKYLTALGEGTRKKHFDAATNKAAHKLKVKYGEVKPIADILTAIAGKTVAK